MPARDNPEKPDPQSEQSPDLLAAPDDQPITARLAAAASRRADLESLLAAAPGGASLEEFRALVIDRNVAGKHSAISRQKLWAQLRQRYLLDRTIPECAAFLIAMDTTSSPWERGLLCLLMMARTDRLFRELALETVSPLLARDNTVVDSDQVQKILEQHLSDRGLNWSQETIVSVRQHLLAALKDFGLLRGAVNKRTVRVRPGPQFALLAARFSLLEGLTPRQSLDSRWYRLVGLSSEQTVSLLYAASRDGILQFRMQAEVIELQLPSDEVAPS